MDQTDSQFLTSMTDLLPSARPTEKISEYVEGKRVLPSSTPFPGPWRNALTPYLVEIMDSLSPYSGITEVWVKKGAQIGATAGVLENGLAYWMDECPSEILFLSATEDALEKWGTKRLEPVIDSCGFRHKMSVPQANAEKTRKSGDKTFHKIFAGGALDMASAQSAASLRSDSKRIVFFDEVDGAPAQLRTGEGNFIDVARVRTNAWGPRKKICGVSTPTKAGQSLISLNYSRGDQRKYFVPCPHCGLFQHLEFVEDANSEHGLKFDGKNAYYQCKGGCPPIFEYHKTAMFADGEWQATAVPESPTIRSYHLNSLYSPVGMLSWNEFWSEYQKALNSGDMKSFHNLFMGEESREEGTRPKIESANSLRGTYRRGTVPDGVLYLTIGCDVQRGALRGDKNPARIELEILGHGFGYRTWSIDYKVFNGKVDDINAGAWAALAEWATETGIVYKRADGREFRPSLILIDSGWEPHVVYQFCQGWTNTFPSKGAEALKKKKGEQPQGEVDEAGPTAYKKYRATKISADTTLYVLSTVHYKTIVYNNLNRPRSQEIGITAPGTCDFPYDYPDDYFTQLIAEEKRRDGSFHLPNGRRNEALDCRVYALAAGDIYLDARVTKAREAAKLAGATPVQCLQITSRTILERIAHNLTLQNN